MRTTLINGRLILPGGIGETGYVVIEDGKIAAVEKGEPAGPLSGEVIDAHSLYISPGFIDLHTHGAGGADFMDGTVEAYLTVAETHARYGTTALLPTTLTCPDEELFHMFDVYTEAKARNTKGAHFLGIHLEGPYFAYSQRGAQDPANLKQPVPEHYMKILEASGDIVRWSIAPELPGALELGRLLKSRHILPSVGHTDAVCEEVTEAFESGYSLMTHLYSGMQGVTRRNAYRYAGAVEAAFLIDGMDVEIIADGIHLPKSLLQLIYKFKGADRIALITDSMRAAGMPEGTYKLGSLKEGQTVVVEDGVAKLPDRTAFAGSVATADRLVRTMVETAGVPLAEAVRMMTATPARILGVNDRKGSLQVGKDADIILFDDHIRVARTLIGGKTVATFDRIV
ncbi:N-acetylglucosamine-6-phosphate deacetylase [uncultured Parabacteroides sp.]|jgi:N-acetylglucosamine-6-phosphate deacetylase|uniref:N-acetylglucosamine-6-phosphate deacetylase n=2 Tax=uncultured Parabacteroides sp. TaxID=512312 RepID=UPI0025E01D60|nr:N-acetylglucosamine-6-phosphate deacetylase [uncultured Parabacteroides sp.]